MSTADGMLCVRNPKGVVNMASIRKRGENSYLLVVSRGYDYQGNRLKPAQKTVHPPKGLTAKQTEKWLNEQAVVPFPVSWTVKMKKKQKETQDILSYHTQAAGCSDKARAKASGGRQPIEECGRTGL